MITQENIEKIIKRVEVLKSKKALYENHFQDLANFCLPSKADITSKKVGSQDFSRIFDSIAIRSLETMSAGFSSHLTNPATKWFSLGTKNKSYMDSKVVQVWFKDVDDEIFSTLSNSNFDSTIAEFYPDAGCFGTGTIMSEPDHKTRVRFTSIPIAEVLFEEDALGRVNRVYRRFEYTAQQAYDRWGKNSGEIVLDAMNSKNTNERLKKIQIIHAVLPRDDRVAGKIDNQNLPIASYWFEITKKHLISESGYNEMPYHIGRFRKLTGEDWGTSPASSALADVKMVNTMKRTLIRAAMKIVDPPFIMPHKGFIQPLNFNPSGANYVKEQTVKDKYQAIETKANIPIGIDLIQDVKNDIEKAFFVPVFQAFIDITKTMTVPEVRERIAENMTLLGPVVGRFTQEVFDPLITRVFMILFRQGHLPPAPEEIIDQELDIQYISQLAKAQRASEIGEIQAFLSEVAGISQVLPAVIDKIDGDKTIDIIAKIRRINPDMLRSTEDVDAIREQRAEKETAQEQLAGAQQVADVVKTGSEAEKNLKEK